MRIRIVHYIKKLKIDKQTPKTETTRPPNTTPTVMIITFTTTAANIF